MTLTPIEIPTFGGLNLRDNATEVGFDGAIDLADVDISGGMVSQRPGFSQLTFAAASAPFQYLAAFGGRIVGTLLGLTKVQVVDSHTGALGTSSSTLSSPIQNLVSFGSSTNSYLYGGTGTSSSTLLRWDGTSFTYPTSITGGAAQFVAVTPWDNRLVLGMAVGDQDCVRFSDPGLPETYTTNSFVRLTPNDGYPITGMVTWNNQLFVFKGNKFFVFYGTSIDSTGQPVFNYRTVANDVGMPAPNACIACSDAVYFVSDDGVYRTTGSSPSKVSQLIDPFFVDSSRMPYFTGDQRMTSSPIQPFLARLGNKLLISYPAGSTTVGRRVLVYDLVSGQWSYWTIPAYGLLGHSFGNSALGDQTLYFAFNGFDSSTTGFHIGLVRYAGNDTTAVPDTDNGEKINALYRSGFAEPQPGHESTIREVELEGQGSVGVSLSRDSHAAVPAITTVAMEPAGRGRYRKAQRGRTMSLSLASVGNIASTWQVNRITPRLRGARDSEATK